MFDSIDITFTLLTTVTIVEAAGYAMRSLSASESFGCWSLAPFIIHSILVLVAPAVIAASIYMLLEEIIRLSNGDSYSIMSPRWITRVFVAGDVASFLIQSYGKWLYLIPDLQLVFV